MEAGGDGVHRAKYGTEPAFDEYTQDSVLHAGGAREIPPDCIDLWAYSLPTHAPLERWLPFLSASERDRANRFVRSDHGVAFAVSHAALRSVLGHYLASVPLDIDIAQEAHGRPFALQSDGKPSEYDFNLAHSENRLLIGVAKGRRIGVDLECEREDIDMLAIADQFFGASEADLVRARSGTERRVSFYRAWVAKEAVLKADGGGLTIPLNRFEVVFANASIGNLRSSDPECSGAGWTVRLLHLACGWHAAVASSDDRWRIRFRTRVAPPGAAPSAIP